jgi:hypothetical protein
VSWDVAYTMTTTPAHERAVESGAIAIRNTTGLVLHGVARVIDCDLGTWRTRIAEKIANALTGGDRGTAPAIVPYALGEVELGPETRIALTGLSAPRAMRSVLIYDPIGRSLDSPSAVPVRDRALGVRPPPGDRLTENLEIQRDPHVPPGLPVGPVRLFERRDDGSLVVLGEGRLFDPATRAAAVDTIPVGAADAVTGHRERREITIDDDHRRLTEEFVITIANARPHPIHALIREHLYRGQNWTLAYDSAPAAEKEGPQQIALRADVPADSHAKIMYVVVYTWDP